MVGGGAQAQAEIRPDSGGVYRYLRAESRSAQHGHAVCAAVVVHNADPLIHRVGHQRSQFLLAPAGMGAVGHQYRHIIRGEAAVVQKVFHKAGNDQVLPHPETGHIADDEHRRLPGTDPFSQGHAVNGMIQTVPDSGADIGKRGDLIAEELRLNLRLIQRDRYASVPVREGIFFHSHAPPGAFCVFLCMIPCPPPAVKR